MAEAPPSKLRQLFGAAVRARRRGMGIYIGAVERAEVNVSIDNIDRISAALGAEAADLLRSS